MAADQRSGRQVAAVLQSAQYAREIAVGQILDEIVVHLNHGRVHAGAEALDLRAGEQPVFAGLAGPDPDFVADGAEHLPNTAQHARRRAAHLEMVPADRGQIDHRVEGRDLHHADLRHAQPPGDMFDRGLGHPAAMLALRQIEQGQHRARLPAFRIAGDRLCRRPAVLAIEGKAVRLVDRRAGRRPAHRSTSPNTISMEPITAQTSASMWPRDMKSVAWRWAKPGARILQR